MNVNQYQIRMNQRALDLLIHADNYDPDVWNLEYMITQIRPFSPYWRSGCVRSLRKAIRALEQVEKSHKFEEERS